MIAGMAGTGAERQHAYGGTKEEWPLPIAQNLGAVVAVLGLGFRRAAFVSGVGFHTENDAITAARECNGAPT